MGQPGRQWPHSLPAGMLPVIVAASSAIKTPTEHPLRRKTNTDGP
jgi:hypothetical protein